MNREVKFNAIGDGEYVRFDDWKEDKGSDACSNELLAEFLIEHFGYKLVQYTGLKDQNGTDIYEGDIIKVEGYNNKEGQWIKAFEVVFTDGGFCLRREDKEYAFFGHRAGNNHLKKGIIVGNIYENLGG